MKKWRFKSFLPRQLQSRLLFILIAPMILLQLIALWVFFDRNWDTMTKQLSLALVQDIQYAIHIIQTTSPDHRDPLLEEFAQINHLNLQLEQGKTIVQGQSGKDFIWGYKRFLANDLSQSIALPFIVTESPQAKQLHIAIALDEGLLQISFSRGRLYSSTTLLFILFTFLGFIIFGATAILLARHQARPIIRLAHAMDDFGKGEKITPPPLEGSEEARLAIRAFALMRERIHHQITQREQMLTAISHDLNSALSRIKLNLAIKDESQSKELIEQDVTDIQNMVEDYIAFVRSKEIEKKQPIAIRALWQAVCRQFQHHAIHHDNSEERITVQPKQFQRCLFNMVDNATHYSKKIELQAKKTAHHLEIIIDDDGIGIPKKERINVFNPFYRLEPSRNRATGGLGLGLSIAQDIMKGHKGRIMLEDSPLGGLRVRLIVPL